MGNEMMQNTGGTERKHYIDNIRWATVLVVVLYHVIYSFNTVGVIKNVDVDGIPQFNAILSFIYPWFMCLLFVVGGMSIRYSLEKRTGNEFAKNRVTRLLIPSIAGIFILGWVTTWVTGQYSDLFAGNGDLIPGPIKYIIYCLFGVGPLWFAHELFLGSMIILLIRAIDKKDKLWNLGGKVKFWMLLLMVIPVWISSWLFNTPLIEVYRNGIYIFMILLGYFVFSHEEVTDSLVKFKLPLLIVAILTGIAYSFVNYGENYTTRECLKSPFTNAYLWVMVLAIIGCFKAWGNQENQFTKYMVKRNFGFYALHYPVLVMIAYLVTTYLQLLMLLVYGVVLLGTVIIVPLLYEAISRIPILRLLLLGITKK